MIIKEIHYLEIATSFINIFNDKFIENKNGGTLFNYLNEELIRQNVPNFKLNLGLFAITLQFDPQFKEQVLQAFKVCKSF